MKDMMVYKNYYGSVHYNDEDSTFYGKIAFIKSLISYEGQTVSELKSAFHEAVDDYLETCEAQGIEPEQPFKGSFNVRVGENLHRNATAFAKSQHINLNTLTKKALEEYLDNHR